MLPTLRRSKYYAYVTMNTQTIVAGVNMPLFTAFTTTTTATTKANKYQ